MKKRNEKQMFKILKKLLDVKEINFIQQYIVYRDVDGSYVLYGEYNIKYIDGFYVLSKVHTFTTRQFNFMKNAIIWAILDKYNKIVELKEIEHLDMTYASSNSHIELQKKLISTAKSLDVMALANTKLQEEQIKIENISQRINDYILLANRCQDNMFRKAVNN